MSPTLEQACKQAEINALDARLLRAHSNSVYLLPRAGLVARIGGGFDAIGRATRAVEVCRWLATCRFKAVRPADIEQPVIVSTVPVTFWAYIPGTMPPEQVAVFRLGELLAWLHRLPPCTVDLPMLEPLARLEAALAADEVLPVAVRRWLSDRAALLGEAWALLESPLGTGLVHGDAQAGNLIRERGTGKIWLADWDSVAIGPREWDLVSAHVEHRFGVSRRVEADMRLGYGRDITYWPQWTAVRDVYELRSLAAHIRRANEGSQPHLAEALHRISTLQAGDLDARWHGVG